MNNVPTILIIDDEAQIRRFLRVTLEANNYTVIEAENGKDGIYQAAMRRPNVVVLDLGLPDMKGTEVLTQIRQWSSVPILILSVQDGEADKVAAFDAGADDYVTKPFATGELMARLRVALKHSQPVSESSEFVNGDLVVDLANRQVLIRGNKITLSPTEYSLLVLFVKHAGKVLTHRQIMKEIWGPFRADETQYIRVYMAQLRKKLESDPAHPAIFLTISGVGYRMAFHE